MSAEPTADTEPRPVPHAPGWSVAVLLAAPVVAALPSLGRLSLGEAILAPLVVPLQLMWASGWLPLLGLMLASGLAGGAALVVRRHLPTTILGGTLLLVFSAGAQVILSAAYA